MTRASATMLVNGQIPLFDPTWPAKEISAEASRRGGGAAISSRRDRRDVFNARLVDGLTLVGPYEIPRINPCTLVPKALMAFSEISACRRPDKDVWVHFYEDDYRFARLWNAPEKYMIRLAQFGGVISPDFSLYRNMPAAQKIFNAYRNQLLGARMQAAGIHVVANVRLSGRESIPYALAGIPEHATVALGLTGCTRDPANRRHVKEEVRIICDELTPANVVAYGSDAYGVLDYPIQLGIPVHVFHADSFVRVNTRKAAA